MFTLSNATKRIAAVGLLICAVILGSAFPRTVEANTMLGTAQAFAVLGASTVTNTGPSIVTGDLGVWPGTAVVGFPPGVVNGTQHINNGVAQQAQADVTGAYNTLAGLACDEDLTGQDLGGMVLTPGVYCFDVSAQLTGTVTLDALGDPDALFVFQIGSTLTTASSSSVLMDGGTSCNVLWQVGSSATLGTTTAFTGNILALASITLNTSATINGRALARTGAVTMDSNVVTNAECVTVDVPTATPTSTPTDVPEEPTATPTTVPGEPTATPTTVPGEPTATTGPGTTVPSTSTPIIPGPGTPIVTPPIQTPGPGTPTSTMTIGTPIITDEETPVVIIGTPTPITGTPDTSTPITGTPDTSTPITGTPSTSTPIITTQSTPSVTISTSTPTATSTSVTVWFPNTGSGGGMLEQTSQSAATTSLAISIALVLLLTGGLAFAVERRSRR